MPSTSNARPWRKHYIEPWTNRKFSGSGALISIIAGSMLTVGCSLFRPETTTVVPDCTAENDRTARYHELLEQKLGRFNHSRAVQRARAPHRLFIRGFLSDAISGDYFADQRRHIQGSVPDEDRYPNFDSEDLPEVNAAKISEAIRRIDRTARTEDIILVSHSKGSLDTLYMLLNEENSDIRSRIACWVSLQGAIRGSLIPDFVASTPVLEEAADEALKWLFQGDSGALQSLTQEHANAYIANNSAKINQLVENIPVVSYGSALERPNASPLGALDLAMKVPSDGLMPIANTIIPRSTCVIEPEGPDHAAVVLKGGYPFDFQRVRFVDALIRLCLEQGAYQ